MSSVVLARFSSAAAAGGAAKGGAMLGAAPMGISAAADLGVPGTAAGGPPDRHPDQPVLGSTRRSTAGGFGRTLGVLCRAVAVTWSHSSKAALLSQRVEVRSADLQVSGSLATCAWPGCVRRSLFGPSR